MRCFLHLAAKQLAQAFKFISIGVTTPTKVELPSPAKQPDQYATRQRPSHPIPFEMSSPSTAYAGASYPADLSWYEVPSAALSDDPAALTQFRILPVTVATRTHHITEKKKSPAITNKEALMIELQYRHGTLKRQLILKDRFRGAASIEKKGRHEVAINYLSSDDPTKREITEHIYFPTPLDAMDFHMRLTEFL